VVISRGADKALRIRDELGRACSALKASIRQGETALEKLAGLPDAEVTALLLQRSAEEAGQGTQQQEMMAAAMHRQKHRNLLTGCLPPLRETLRWLQAIEDAAGSHASRLFVAGDNREPGRPPPAMCLPAGFDGCRALDEGFREVLLEYTPQMRQVLETDGWPEHVSSRRGVRENGAAAEGCSRKRPPEKVCRGCDRQFSALWIDRGVCCECEELARSKGCCPFGTRCKPAWFCKHARRCFICDAHSCEDCRLTRGDGEAVVELASHLRPHRIALDFDRTLASTRTGGMPIFGKHAVDTELLSLLSLNAKTCSIITRNSHVAEIKSFLHAHGAPDVLAVHSLRRPASKAERLVPDLGADERAVLVDDSIEELVDPLVASDERVHRVLFVRGLL